MGALPEEVRRVLGPVEQELQMAVGHHVRNQAPGPLEEQQVLPPTELLSQVKSLQSPCTDHTQAHSHTSTNAVSQSVSWLKEPWRSSSRLAGKPES